MSETFQALIEYDEKMFDSFEVLRCRRCQCSFFPYNPTVDQLKEVYGQRPGIDRRA